MDPSLCSGFQRETLEPDLRFFHNPYALFEHVEGDIHLLRADHQRRRDANRIFAGAEIQDTALERQLDDAIALIVGPGAALLVLHDLHADHQPPAANVADHGMLLDPIARPLHDAIAHGRGVAHALALENVERGQRGLNAYGIAAESGGVRTRHPVHDFGSRHRDPQRHAGSNAFGYGDDVRLNSGVFDRPPFSAASGSALNLIGHQQDSVLIADAAQLLHELVGRGQVAAFALNRLDEDGGAL